MRDDKRGVGIIIVTMPTEPPPLSYYGPNADPVNEVIAFAFSQHVFCSVGQDERRESLVIVSDMVRAVDAAGGVGPESTFPLDRDQYRRLLNGVIGADDEATLLWIDLKKHMIAKHIWTAQWYEWRKANAAAVRTLESMDLQWHRSDPRPLYEHLRTRLPEGPPGPDGSFGYYRDYIADNASSDLRHCAENRAFNGITDNFWESLFLIYRTGLWPCGWRGTWPSPGVPMAWRRPSSRLTHRQPWPSRLTRPHIVGRWLRGWRVSDDR